jgi:small subunit ribosomal protein S17
MQIFKGKVISVKMNKTATLVVDRVVKHPFYEKRYRQTKKYHVHDTFGVKVGDEVKFVASKPYSKLKRWKITEILTGQKSKPERKHRPTKGKKGTNL